MSTTIDNRIVEMQFDNKQFERNAQTSLGTLAKLKQSLNLTGAAKGLENVNAAAKNCNLSPLHTAAETVGLKFNAMYTMADQALRNITNSAVNAGKRITSALTIQPVKMGFSEYETQIGAIQTILANTESKGSTLDDVNSALDELNTYADKTIYNFTEMTRNIGTFTAAGVDLDKSVTSIKGIANLAAVSGSTSQQASTAMYQLSQALASGTVKLMDWNSVVNAGMGGEVFQTALKRTAKQMGYNVDEMIEKYGSFRESLTQGEWLTADVLTETLTQLSGAYTKADLIAQGYTESQADEIVKLANTAEGAATNVKTFTQLIDTTKESLQSGWTQTWETIIGDFEEAKELWSGISEALGGMIGKSADARNKLLSGAFDSNWSKITEKVEEAGVKTEDFENKVKEAAKAHGLDIDKIIEDHGSLEKAFQKGAISADILKEALGGLTKAGKKLGDFNLDSIERTLKVGYKGDDVKEAEKALKALGYSLTGKDGKEYGDDGYYGSLTADAVKAFQAANNLKATGELNAETLNALKKAASDANEEIVKLDDSIWGLVDGVDKLGGRQLMIESFKNIFEGLGNIIKPIKDAFRDIFPPMTAERLYELINGFNELTAKFKEWTASTEGQATIGKLTSAFKGFFSLIDIGLHFVKDFATGIKDLVVKIFPSLGGGIVGIAGSIGEWLTGIRDSVKETNIFSKIIGGITGFLGSLIDKLKIGASFLGKNLVAPGWEGFLNILKGIWEFVSKLGSKLAEIGKNIGSIFVDSFRTGDFANALDVLNGGLFASVLLNLKKFIKGLGKADDEGGFLDNIKETLNSVKDSLEAWQQNLQAGTLLKIAGAIGVLALSILVIASINPERLASSLGAITVLFAELMGSLKIFSMIDLGGVGGMTKAVSAMIGISIAILILASALKNISDLNWEELGRGLVGIAGLMAIVVVALKKLSTDSDAIVKGATQMAIFALAVKILASVCKDLSSLSWEELVKGLLGVGALMTGVALFMNNTQFQSKGVSTALGIIGISAAIKIMASACKDFSELSWEGIAKGLAGVGATLLGVWALNKYIKNPESMMSTAVSLVIIGGAMKIFASVLKDVSGLNYRELATGLIGIAGTLLAVVKTMNGMSAQDIVTKAGALAIVSVALLALAKVLTQMGGLSVEQLIVGLAGIAGSLIILSYGMGAMGNSEVLQGSAALLVASLALGVLAPVLKALGGMEIMSIVKALAAIAGVFVVLGVAGAVLGPIAPVIITLAGAMALIGVGALAFGAGLLAAGAGLSALAVGGAAAAAAIFTFIQQIGYGFVEVIKIIGASATEIGKAAKAIILSLIDVFIECVPALADGILKLITELLSSLAEYTPQIVNALMDFLIGTLDALAARTPELVSSMMNVVTSLFSAVADAIVGLDGSALEKSAIGVALIGALIAIFSVLAPMIPGAIIGILGMGVIIAELALVLAAIGALAQIPGLRWLVNEGGEMMKSIGGAIGGFVGSVIGGIASGVTSSLPQIGSDLSTFMTNLDPFLEGAKSIDSTALDGVKTITDIILALTGANILEGIAKWITGESSITTFSGQLKTFGEGLKDFATEVTGIDTAAISAAATAASDLMTTASQIPNEGGILSWFVGDNTIGTFATGLKSFGTGLKDFATEVTGIDTGAITAASTAASTLISTASTIPNQGGILSWIVGDNTIGKFASGLKSFGTGLKDFATEVTGIDTSGMALAITAANSLISTASSIPNEGGILSWIVGDNTMTKFANGLKSFGTGLKDFATEVSGIDAGAVTAAAAAAQALADVSISLADGQSFMEWLTNAGDLSTFGSKLKGLGEGLASLGTSINVEGFDVTKVAMAVTQISRLTGVAERLGDGADFGSLSVLAGWIKELGTALNNFHTNTADIDASKFSTIANGLQTLASIDIKNADTISSFIASLGTVATDGIDAFANAFSDKTTEVLTAIGTMLTTVTDSVSKYGKLGDTFTTMVTDVATALGSETIIAKFETAGSNLVSGFASGITSNTFRAVAAASAMASLALTAAKAVLRINSPSKVFMGVGESVPEGFAMGIDSLGYMVVNSARTMANDAFNGTKKVISRLAGAVMDGIDAQPTIRPVLDLSEVTAGAGAINGMFDMQPSVGVMSNVGAISSMMGGRQNGGNGDVISAIKDLGNKIGSSTGDTYTVGNVTYDDGSNVANTVKSLTRAVRVERRR